MPVIDRYLELAIAQKASDLHFASDQAVRLRIHGDLAPLDEKPLTSDELEEVLFEILTAEEKAKLKQTRNLDKSLLAPGIGNFRVNIFYTRNGVSAVLRTIPTRIPSIAELGLPEVCKSLCELGKGLVLVTGPTGSGKSTTLAAMIHYINESFPHHILTVEDPVEFVHESNHSLINQREIGSSCLTFADALKYALREDPDVILVGEMRDLETIALALTAAETGHLVFGTLHTRGAAASVDRIIDSFPGNQQAMIRTMLAESLAAVISQALLKRADGVGRVAAYEIMVVNHAISNLVREGKTFQIPSIIQTARKEGMILMDQHIRELITKRVVNQEEASGYLSDGGGQKRNLSTTGASATSPATKPIAIKAGLSARPGAPPSLGGSRPAAPPKLGAPGGPTKIVPPPRNSPPVVSAEEPAVDDDSVPSFEVGIPEDTNSGFERPNTPIPAQRAVPTPMVPARPAAPGVSAPKGTGLPPPPVIGKKKTG